MKKEHCYELDFIRAVSAVIVVCYHFACACSTFEVHGFHNIFYVYPNGTCGEMAVSIFFMLSGAALIYNYRGKKISVGQFYKKRWLSLFPMFYLTWIIMYAYTVISDGRLFWGGDPRLIILSVLGMDGYFYYLKTNYYLIGEWFLGAIIFLYLLFPLLKLLFEKVRWQCSVVLAIAWGGIFFVDWFKIDSFRNLITCLCSFWIGMLLMEYEKEVKRLWPCSLVVLVSLFIWKFPVNTTLAMNLTAVAAFSVLYTFGRWIMKSAVLKKGIRAVSNNSYGIFLTHHVIIDNWVKRRQYGYIDLKTNILWLLAVIALSYISAVIIQKMTAVLHYLFASIKAKLF